jgi:hypothetical protein
VIPSGKLFTMAELQRRKLRHGRRGLKNPFANQGGKENFPNIDTLFGNKELDQSYYSQEGSSILNMSIGARAALNDHLRHVEKYGIDGEQQQETAISSSRPKNSLDVQWDRLLDSSHVDVSGSFAAVSSHPRLDILADSSGIEESIEVMTDISHDYFNSSRVKMLGTPERNLNRPEMVMTRQEMQEQCLFEEESDFEPADDHVAPELKMKMTSQHSSGSDSSFHSFCAADLSRISNTDSEPPGLPVNNEVELSRISNSESELRGVPEESLHEKCLKIDEGAFSPIMKDLASPIRVHDSSFSSTPRRSPQSFDIGLEFKLPTTLSSFVKRALLHPRRRSENEDQPFLSDLSPFQEPDHVHDPNVRDNLPPITRARTFGREASEMPAVDSMPADFLRALESAKMDGLSPISQTGSQAGASILNRSTQRESDKSSSASGSFSGRKRYRTVVPRRVYLDSPSQFPEEYDSFSRPSGSGPGSSQDSTQRSLLDSFDAVVHSNF